MKQEFKGTKTKFHPVQYANYWQIQKGEYYGDADVLDCEKVGEVQAEANAQLFATSPELLNVPIDLNTALDNYWNSTIKTDSLIKAINRQQQKSLSIIKQAIAIEKTN